LFQRLNRARFIDVDDCIELFRESRVKIVAQSFAFRAVNYADGALDPPLLQEASLTGTSQIDPKPR
jgi:hypothetical protein